MRRPVRFRSVTGAATLFFLITVSALHSQSIDTSDQSKSNPIDVFLKPGGGGLNIVGEDFAFRLRSYIQAGIKQYDTRITRALSGNSTFYIRRVRFDFRSVLYDRFTAFLEINGSSSSNFNLINGWLDWSPTRGFGVKVGKQKSPFSAEHLRSSRSLETTERSIGISGVQDLPALQGQTGITVHGETGDETVIRYAAGVLNGNGKESSTFEDNNDQKEVAGRLEVEHGAAEFGLSLDASHEREQQITIQDLAGNLWYSVAVHENRYGIGADAFVEKDRFSVRSEGLAFTFETPTSDENVDYYGAYVQPAFFVTGSKAKGVQVLARGELVGVNDKTVDSLRGNTGDMMVAGTVGLNIYANPNARLQVNVTAHRFNGASPLLGFDEARWSPFGQALLQVKL